MNNNATSLPAATDLTDWARIDALSDAEIDQSDHPEWTAAQFATAKRRGPGRAARKVSTTMCLDADLLDAMKATGPGWQTRANDAMRAAFLSPPAA